jgi:hypothetical protein
MWSRGFYADIYNPITPNAASKTLSSFRGIDLLIDFR